MSKINLCFRGAVLGFGYLVLVAAAPLHGVTKTQPGDVPYVAVIHLLFDDKVYEGKVVMVRGFLGGSGGSSSLYPTREDFLMENESVGISIQKIPPQLLKGKCWNRFVAVKGIFSIIKETGVHIIENIEFIDAYDFSENLITQSFCYKAERKK